MKNFRDSDYAANVNSDGIVYLFNGEAVTYTLDDFLKEEPGKTEEDFHRLKIYSDAIYKVQDRKMNAQTKKNDPLHLVGDQPDRTADQPESAYIENNERETVRAAYERLLVSGTLTGVQERRLLLHIDADLSLRKIASREGTSHVAVNKSIQQAVQKIKKYL